MKILGQRDPRWKDMVLGKSGLTMGHFGCFVTALSSILDKLPSEVLELLNKNDCFDDNGMMDDVKAARVLGLDYRLVNKNPMRMCIAWVDYSPAPGLQSHFVVWLGDGKGTIMDPWAGILKQNHWRVVNYRIFEQKVYPARPPEPDKTPTSEAETKLAELNTAQIVAEQAKKISIWDKILSWIQGLFNGRSRN